MLCISLYENWFCKRTINFSSDIFWNFSHSAVVQLIRLPIWFITSYNMYQVGAFSFIFSKFSTLLLSIIEKKHLRRVVVLLLWKENGNLMTAIFCTILTNDVLARAKSSTIFNKKKYLIESSFQTLGNILTNFGH